MAPKTIKSSHFDLLVTLHGLHGESVEACRRVLVEGATAYQAAKELGLSRSTVSRALKKLDRSLCPHCGQPLK